MTDLEDLNQLAERIIDIQYDDEIYDENSLWSYIDGYLPSYLTTDDIDKSAYHKVLTSALNADLKDWLSNGNELLEEDIDLKLIQDDEFRQQICHWIATNLLARI